MSVNKDPYKTVRSIGDDLFASPSSRLAKQGLAMFDRLHPHEMPSGFYRAETYRVPRNQTFEAAFGLPSKEAQPEIIALPKKPRRSLLSRLRTVLNKIF